MLYATIGIPLAMIVLANLGHKLTILLKFLWSFIRRYYYTGYCTKVLSLHRDSISMKATQYSTDATRSQTPVRTDRETHDNDNAFPALVETGAERNGMRKVTIDVDEKPHPLHAAEHNISRGNADALASVDRCHANGKVSEFNSEVRGDKLQLSDSAPTYRFDSFADRAAQEKRDVNVVRISEDRDRRSESTDRQSRSSSVDRAKTHEEEVNLPVVVAVFIIFTYIVMGAFMYTLWEDWTYLESFYFVFITISTIGYGDIIPQHPNFFLLSCVYTFMGLALLSMTANVIMEFLSESMHRAKKRVGHARDVALTKARAASNTLTKVGGKAKRKVVKTIAKADHFIVGKEPHNRINSDDSPHLNKYSDGLHAKEKELDRQKRPLEKKDGAVDSSGL